MTKLILVLLSVVVVDISQAATCGRIAKMKGQVEVLRVKDVEGVRKAMAARPRMKLDCLDVVVTGKASRAKLRFKGNAVVSLGPNSRLEVIEQSKNKSQASQLKLTFGKMRALFKKKIPKKLPKKGQRPSLSTFRISTPSAVAGVRGTDFFMSFEPNTGVTEQATIEGRVEVVQKNTGQKVIVDGGKQVTVDKIPEQKGSSFVRMEMKSLQVAAIEPQIVEEIRQTSVIVKNDKDFATKEAVSLLGKPSSWQPPKDEIPLDLKGLKEEF